MLSSRILARNSRVRFHCLFSFSRSSRLRHRSGTFADGQLTDALKNLATDRTTDPKVKKKVLAVLASWSRQFKDDRNAAAIAGLYRQVKPAEPPRRSAVEREQLAEREREAEQKRTAKETKQKAKEERLRLEEEARRKKVSSRTTTTTRKPFDFEQVGFSYGTYCCEQRLDIRYVQEKTQVLMAIASAWSAANNLANAITVGRHTITSKLTYSCTTEARQH